MNSTETPIARSPTMNWFVRTSPGGQGQGALADIIDGLFHAEPSIANVASVYNNGSPTRINIRTDTGGDLFVEERDVDVVMAHAEVSRGEAVRALRRYDGDLVDSILMLSNPDTPRQPRRSHSRDPMQTSSDEQATTWFLQRMFGDHRSFYNTYSDMLGRMNYTLRRNPNWQHEENEDTVEYQGYESA